MEDFNEQQQITGSDRDYNIIEPVIPKTFFKNDWLEKLAKDIEKASWTEEEREDYITIDSLQDVLKYYFPKIKLTQHDRTPTNTGDNTRELASDTTATIRQSEDENDTRASATSMQMVSS